MNKDRISRACLSKKNKYQKWKNVLAVQYTSGSLVGPLLCNPYMLKAAGQLKLSLFLIEAEHVLLK